MFNRLLEMFGTMFLRNFIVLMVVLTIVKVIRAGRPNAKEFKRPSALSVVIALLLIACTVFGKVASSRVAVGGDVPFFERHEAVVTEVMKSTSVEIEDDGEEYESTSYTAYYEYEENGVKKNGSGESFMVEKGDTMNVYTAVNGTTVTDYTLTWISASVFILCGAIAAWSIPGVIGNMLAYSVQKRRLASQGTAYSQYPPMQ